MAKQLKVTQVKSAIGRPEQQKRVLAGLGLSRTGKSKVLIDTDAIRGMIRKVQHLVRVEPADG